MKRDADKILEALGIQPGAPRRALGPAGHEPVVIRHRAEATFGTIMGQQTIAEVQDLMTVESGRMTNMANAYAAISPTWVQKDSAGFVDWTNDWNALQVRYTAAFNAAQSTVAASQTNPLPASLIPAQAEYDGLLKAFRQCAPPDGCPTVKGDWEDLFSRLTVAAKTYGTPAPVDNPPQPTATDVDQKAITVSAPVDAVAMVTGAQQPKGPLGAILQGIGLTPGSGTPTSTSGLTYALMGVIAGAGGMIGFSAGGPVGGVFGAALGLAGYEIVKLKLASILKL